jgi:ferrous iron transport protein B
VILIADATHLQRSLLLATQVLSLDLPTVVALNMTDVALREGTLIDVAGLESELKCTVVPVSGRSGTGIDQLRDALDETLNDEAPVVRSQSAPFDACLDCPYNTLFRWTDHVATKCLTGTGHARRQRTDRLDGILTHPLLGSAAFVGVMAALFLLIFELATVPMDLIDGWFGWAGSWVRRVVPEGAVQSLLADGVIAGVGSVLVFLPQIGILFFLLTMLEDSGYLARAAFVMDRLMRRVGLPGTAFIPLLSAHACAVPAIMGARVVPDWRDRLVTILVAPLMSCSARIPVYVMLTTLLFPLEPAKAAFAFTAAYLLGIAAALGVAFVFSKTIARGQSRPLAIELPDYQVPSLRNAFVTMADRAAVFVRQAGTFILLFSIGLWFLSYYPGPRDTDVGPATSARVESVAAASGDGAVAAVVDGAVGLDTKTRIEHSFIGYLGRVIEPVVEPLGFDWRMGIGILTSFAAREIVVSTLTIVYGAEPTDSGEASPSLYQRLRQARRPDGSLAFSMATCLSMLVFYVLAMQCMATLAVVRRETGTWKWPAFQFAYMTVLAYTASLLTYQIASVFVA